MTGSQRNIKNYSSGVLFYILYQKNECRFKFLWIFLTFQTMVYFGNFYFLQNSEKKEELVVILFFEKHFWPTRSFFPKKFSEIFRIFYFCKIVVFDTSVRVQEFFFVKTRKNKRNGCDSFFWKLFLADRKFFRKKFSGIFRIFYFCKIVVFDTSVRAQEKFFVKTRKKGRNGSTFFSRFSFFGGPKFFRKNFRRFSEIHVFSK